MSITLEQAVGSLTVAFLFCSQGLAGRLCFSAILPQGCRRFWTLEAAETALMASVW